MLSPSSSEQNTQIKKGFLESEIRAVTIYKKNVEHLLGARLREDSRRRKKLFKKRKREQWQVGSGQSLPLHSCLHFWVCVSFWVPLLRLLYFCLFVSFFLSNVQWGSMLMVFQVFELKFICSRSDFSRLPYLDLCFHKVIFFGDQWRLGFLDQSTHTYIKETKMSVCFLSSYHFCPIMGHLDFWSREFCDP